MKDWRGGVLPEILVVPMKLFVSSCVLAVGCHSVAEPAPPPPAALVAAPPPRATPVAAAPAFSGERYVGSVGGSPVHADLQIAPNSMVGRLYYEKGSQEGLRLASFTKGVHGFELHESGDDGIVTGDLNLELRDQTWSGTWSKPGQLEGPEIRLTRELRSKVGDVVVSARPIVLTYAGGGGMPRSKAAGFLPRVSGPGSEVLAPKLTLATLLDETEDDLSSATSLDFTVPFHDARFVTFELAEETMGAYPDSHGARRTYSWRTGARVGVEALLPEKRAALVKLLDKRVHSAWKSQRKQLATPSDETDCGPDAASGFMGHAVAFPPQSLGDLSLDAKGVTFAFDFGFPHAVAACEPTADTLVTWKELKPFLDPKGPLAEMP